jgi:hypothetical protein
MSVPGLIYKCVASIIPAFTRSVLDKAEGLWMVPGKTDDIEIYRRQYGGDG